nr:uncharacterized protein LOC106028976 [Cavia porcellus]
MAASCEKYECCSADLSEPSSLVRLPPSPKASSTHLRKCHFDEYKRIAPEMLGQLENMLQRYSGRGIPLPKGLTNLVDDGWPDLEAGTPQCPAPSLQGQPVTPEDFKQCRASSEPMEGFCKQTHPDQARQEDHIPATLASHDQLENSSPDVIQFSLSSKICLESDWLFQRPYSRSEILKWKAVLGAAVRRLQEALARIKTEEAQLKRKGFDRCPILHYYSEPEGEGEGPSPQATLSFWRELLERRPQLLAQRKEKVGEAARPRRKFHCALADGSSLI